jgi:hypothetical protein
VASGLALDQLALAFEDIREDICGRAANIVSSRTISAAAAPNRSFDVRLTA